MRKKRQLIQQHAWRDGQFSDLNHMVTIQNLYHDGGYSSTGVTSTILEKFGIDS